MKLPAEFLDKMRRLLGDKEYGEFIKSYDIPRYYGLRVNTLKTSVEEFLRISPFELEKIPWVEDGFYYKEGESPGKHPYYHAGLYYIQEPSAMFPAAVLDAKPGEHVLDLCAAPGGKSVQIAASMKGKGILVANDINSDRVKALVKNLELCGARNAIVTNEPPDRLAVNFAGYFDRILVDAPCSGEGMFRKDEDAVRSWQKFKCDTCAAMQREILKSVDRMLRPGGYMVYSTCTFSPEENEQAISDFLAWNNGNYEIMEIPKLNGIEGGKPEWSDGNPELTKTARLWPHKVKGEGHFVALLRKKNGHNCSDNASGSQIKDEEYKKGKKNSGSIADESQRKAFNVFVNENLNLSIDGFFIQKGNNLYCLPEEPPDLNGIKVAKFGWYLGEFARGIFEPSHSLAVSLKKGDIKNTVDFSPESREIIGYLRGETVMVGGKKGLTAVCVNGYTLGWAKQMGNMLKNLYPKGWRRMS
ncbi:MAG TPA: NOL1/NOP2/sun family putative RNA methylase [Clostridiaceae bacterium]|nr:NOL1/NOP2/sun family putative RNA methylase [Clostridiaceae bacterium]